MPAGSGFVNLSQNVPTTIRDGLRIGWNQKAAPC